jgi:hypothetical protein
MEQKTWMMLFIIIDLQIFPLRGPIRLTEVIVILEQL